MKATDLLRQQHRQLEEMLRRVPEVGGGERAALCGELSRALRGHNTIEEELFYPRLQDREDLADLVADSFEEHRAAIAVLGSLERALANGGGFEEHLVALTQMVFDHVAKEEERLLPRVEELWTDEMLEESGRELEVRFEQLESEEEARV
jgi:hemerythrin superfamily protein